MSQEATVNMVAGLVSLAVEFAAASNIAKEDVDRIYAESYEKVKAKDPATHAHPDFGDATDGGGE